MQMIDFFPTKGFFQPGEPVCLVLEVPADPDRMVELAVEIFHLKEAVGQLHRSIRLTQETQRIEIEWEAPLDVRRGYGAQAKLYGEDGKLLDRRVTAFDILENWCDFPRYGFLCEFSPDQPPPESKLERLVRFHINGLQFYDWQYRHHCLLSPTTEFTDPLGRQLSLATIRNLLEQAHNSRMAGMAYLAVYAAGLDFQQEHLDWALYDQSGKALTFAGFLGLMDPTPGRGWARHLEAECSRLLVSLPFDGLHVDQYGEPKEGYDGIGHCVDLPGSFSDFVSHLKGSHPTASVLFNAVGNWPVEALSVSPVDAVYIEIWPPATRYSDVKQIVHQARWLSGGKPVIIALYIPPDNKANILLADAIILATGGTRIELGEGDRLLADPYFPKHQAISPDLYQALRRYADFAVQCGELVGPAARDEPECQVNIASGIWNICRSSPGWLVVNLINTTGLGDPCWDQPHGFPEPVIDLEVEILAQTRVQRVWMASPDRSDIALRPMEWVRKEDRLVAHIPRLDIWSLVALELL